jgi:histidyl-tRNA synthetase
LGREAPPRRSEMPKQIITRPRGTSDILPADTPVWRYLEELAINLFESYGYGEIRVPVFEDSALFERGVGETTDIVEKEMYTFADRKGRTMALRPEGTASVVRAYVEHKMYAQQPIQKLYYRGPMFRYERPQAGRERQFYQLGIESLGSEHPAVDFEVIYIAFDYYRRLGLKSISIKLNSLGCSQDRVGYSNMLRDHFATVRDGLCANCNTRLERNPLRILDCKEPQCKELAGSAPSSLDGVCAECREHFDAVLGHLREFDVPFDVDTTIVRGLDYYTRTVFEVVHSSLGAQDALMGGGRYDDLVELMGGPSTPAAGFALGVGRAILALRGEGIELPSQRPPDLYIAAIGDSARKKGLSLAVRARSNALRVEMDYEDRSFKSHLRNANRLGARFVAIIGEDEVARDVVQLRNMAESTQVELTEEKTLEELTGSKSLPA